MGEILNIFELIYVAWKRERQSHKLESLEIDFFSKIRPYVTHLESQYKNEKDNLVAKLFKRRWERVNYLLNDLITIRMNKHFKESINDFDIPEELPEEEIAFRKKLDSIQRSFRDEVLNINDVSIELVDDDGNDYEFIIFNTNEDTIAIGTDFCEYGPFRKNDIVLMPRDNLRNYVIKSKGNEISIN